MRWTRADRPDLARFPRRRSRGGGGKAKWEGKKRRRDVPVVLPDADAGVGGAEVDADGGTVNLSHDVLLWWSKCVWVATVEAVRACWKVMRPTRRKRQFAFFRSRCFRFHDGPRPSFEPERKAKRHARVDEPRKMEKMDDGNDGEKIDRGSGVPVISDSDSVRTVTWKWGP